MSKTPTTEFEIFTDILTRGGVRWYLQEWMSFNGDERGNTVVMEDWSDQIPIDFHKDGSVVEAKIPMGYK